MRKWIEDNRDIIKIISSVFVVFCIFMIILFLALPSTKDKITVLEISETDEMWRVVYDSTSDYYSTVRDKNFNTLEGALNYARLHDKRFYEEYVKEAKQ